MGLLIMHSFMAGFHMVWLIYRDMQHFLPISHKKHETDFFQFEAHHMPTQDCLNFCLAFRLRQTPRFVLIIDSLICVSAGQMADPPISHRREELTCAARLRYMPGTNACTQYVLVEGVSRPEPASALLHPQHRCKSMLMPSHH